MTSEARSKEPKDSLSKKAGVVVFSRILTALSTIISASCLTKLLSQTDYALLNFLLTSYLTALTLGQLGLPESVFYFFEKIPAAARKSLVLLVGRILLMLGAASCLIFVILTFVAPHWGFPVENLYLPLGFVVAVDLWSMMMPNVLIALDKAKQSAWLNVISGIAQLSSLVIPAALGYPVQTILWCFACYGMVRFVAAATFFKACFPGKGTPLEKGMVRRLLNYSVPVSAAQILWGLNKQLDKYVVAAFLPASVYAVYTNGAWEVPIIPTIAYSVAAVMMPSMVRHFANNEKKELLTLWLKSIKKVSIVVLPLTMLVELIADELVVLLYTPEYIDSAIPLRIYTLMILQRVGTFSALLRAMGDTKTITRSAFLMICVNMFLNFPLLWMLGFAGPAVATLVANLCTWVYAFRIIATRLDRRIRDIFPFAFYFKVLTVATLPAIAITLFKKPFFVSAWLELMWKIAAYLASYITLATLTRLISKEDWRFFIRQK